MGTPVRDKIRNRNYQARLPSPNPRGPDMRNFWLYRRPAVFLRLNGLYYFMYMNEQISDEANRRRLRRWANENISTVSHGHRPRITRDMGGQAFWSGSDAREITVLTTRPRLTYESRIIYNPNRRTL